MHWLEDAIWQFMRVAAFVFQLVGVIGVIAGACLIWLQIYNALIEEDTTNEDQHHTGEEDQPVQQGL